MENMNLNRATGVESIMVEDTSMGMRIYKHETLLEVSQAFICVCVCGSETSVRHVNSSSFRKLRRNVLHASC